MIPANPESILRDACKAADEAFSAIAMRDGVTRQEVEDARVIRDAANSTAHDVYRRRFQDAKA